MKASLSETFFQSNSSGGFFFKEQALLEHLLNRCQENHSGKEL